MSKAAAIRFRGKVYAAGSRHADSLAAMFDALCKTENDRFDLECAIDDGAEPIEFGFAFDDGTEFSLSDMQAARKRLHFGT